MCRILSIYRINKGNAFYSIITTITGQNKTITLINQQP